MSITLVTPEEELLELNQIEDLEYEDFFETRDTLSGQINSELDGIEQAFEAYGKLTHILEKVKGAEIISTETAKISNIAIESICKDISIYKDLLVISSESIEANVVSVEGLTQTLKNIWDAIVRTFKAIWDKIRSFFSKKKAETQLESVKATNASIKEKAKKPKKEATGHEEVLTELNSTHLQMNFQIASDRFAHLRSPITIDSLLTEVHTLRRSLSAFESISSALEVSSVNMQEAVKHLENDLGNMQEPATTFAANAIMKYYMAIRENFKADGTLYAYKKELEEKTSVRFNDIDRKTICSLSGFTRGTKIFAFHDTKFSSNSIVYSFFIPAEYERNNIKPKVEFSSFEEVSVYGEEVVNLFEEYSVLITKYEEHTNRILSKQETLLSQMDKFIHMHEQSNSDIQRKLNTYKAVVRALATTSYSVNSFMSLAEISSMDHSRLLRAAYHLWEPTVQS